MFNKDYQVNTAEGEWIQVEDKDNEKTIADFAYNTGVSMNITKPHCWKCIVVNKGWFKNESNKKPSPLSYTFTLIQKLFEIFGLGMLIGLYHPFCHCREIAIASPMPEQVEIIDLDKKILYAFDKKRDWLVAMGYTVKDIWKFKSILEELSKRAYCEGKYEQVKESIDKYKYGFKINIFINIPGGNEKTGKNYKIKSSYIIFPNGKLRSITPIGGWTK